jgi:hypothetical protein
MEAPLSICTIEEMRGVIRFLLAEGVKPGPMKVQYGDKFTSGQVISKREKLLYAMGIDQEGRQRQGLRTIFKLLKERYGKTDDSQCTTLRRF